MKIVCMSDTHCLHEKMKYKVPDGDMVVHAGDFTGSGTIQQIREFAKWFDSLPHKRKIVICGNHEREVSGRTRDVQKHFKSSLVLHDSEFVVDGLKFWGQPRTPKFYDWGWMYERGLEAEEVWAPMPDDTDIVICHGPPFMYGDKCPDNTDFWTNRLVHVGCQAQLKRLMEVKPKYVICGHIHESFGLHLTDFGTKVLNVSICTAEYRADNPCWIIDTEAGTERMFVTLK